MLKSSNSNRPALYIQLYEAAEACVHRVALQFSAAPAAVRLEAWARCPGAREARRDMSDMASYAASVREAQSQQAAQGEEVSARPLSGGALATDVERPKSAAAVDIDWGKYKNSNDEDEDEAADGCPESMAQAKSLLTTTIAVCFIIGVSSMAATGSVANISTEAQTGQHCAKLEVSYCARVLEASGECPALQGCVSPHDGHELAGGEEEGEGLACLCARHEEHAEHVEGEEGDSGFVDWAFMLASLFFTALGVRKVASSSDAIGPGAPLPQVASQQPSPPPPAAERVDPRAHYEKTGRYMGERTGWCYGDGSFGLGYYKVSSREAFLSVLNARHPSLKFAEENGNFTPASVASVGTGAEVTQKTGWAFGYGPVGLGYYKDPEYKGEGVLPSGVDNPIAGAGVAEGVDGFVGDDDDADDDLIL